MAELQQLANLLAVAIVAPPACFLGILGICSLIDLPQPEHVSSFLAESSVFVALMAAAAMLGLMICHGDYHVVVGLDEWIGIPNHFFAIKLQFDALSISFVIVALLLCGIISAFATKHLHREPSHNRFFVLYGLFVLGMVVASLAGTIETLFIGWELVGLSSALLVAFFHEQQMPVRNGLQAWTVYRVSDAALLMAALWLHHIRGIGDFDALLGHNDWPRGAAMMSPTQAMWVGLLFLVAAAGRSALVPFSGWLPRAMEGPTSAIAVFYGSLSVHLGAFLLLRVGPILELSPALCAIVVVLGLFTAMFAALIARVQTDIRSALTFASLTQVGIIFAEIGLGLRWLALTHIIVHACLRTLQFLWAPILIQDCRTLGNTTGARFPYFALPLTRLAPASVRVWFYRLAMERGYLDGWLNRCFVRPFLAAFQLFDSWERRWTDFLAGQRSRESDLLRHSAVDDLP